MQIFCSVFFFTARVFHRAIIIILLIALECMQIGAKLRGARVIKVWAIANYVIRKPERGYSHIKKLKEKAIKGKQYTLGK